MAKAATKPSISEFEYEEIQYTISEAIESKRTVKLFLADGTKYYTMEGVPIADGSRLSIITRMAQR